MKAISYKHNWLEDIPSHWNKYPLWALFEDNKIKNEGNIISNVLSLSYGNIIKRDVKSNMGLLPASFETYQIVNNGDIVLRLTDLQNDKKSLRVGLVKEEGIITSAYTGLRLKSEDFNSNFYYFFLHSLDIMKYFYSLGGGVRQSIGFVELKWLKLPVPPKTEQDQIVAYIKGKVKKIKHFIKKKQTFIELLKEQRQAVINKAVTKGINPNTKLKNSGIDWLGEIPEHWEVRRLKFAAKINYGISPNEKSYNDKGNGVILINGPVEYSEEDFGLTRSLKWTTEPSKFASKGDLLFCLRGSTTGRLNICHEYVSIGRGVAALKGIEVSQEFLIEFMKVLRKNIEQTFKGSTFPSVNSNDLNNYFITIPSKKEQAQIVSHIKTETAKIDQAIAKAQKEIELIQEYKEAMIAEAVLGKLIINGK